MNRLNVTLFLWQCVIITNNRAVGYLARKIKLLCSLEHKQRFHYINFYVLFSLSLLSPSFTQFFTPCYISPFLPSHLLNYSRLSLLKTLTCKVRYSHYIYEISHSTYNRSVNLTVDIPMCY